MDISLNKAECVVRKNHFGFDRFHNICDQTFVDVPWNAFEWAGASFTGIVLVVMVCLWVSMFRR